MKRPRRVNRRKSKKQFSRTAGQVNRKNMGNSMPMRGGIRL